MQSCYSSSEERFNPRDFSNLPTEILIEIFQYLSFMDRLEASMVCLRWFDALRHMHNKRISLIKSEISDDMEPLSVFLDSNQCYQYITINQSDFGKCHHFWERFSDQVLDLEIIESDIKGNQLVGILQPLIALQKLKIVNCRDLFMYNKVFTTDEDRQALKQPLEGVLELCLADNRYLSDASFERIISLMPNLRSLDLSGCQISFHKGLYKKFYPNSSFQKGASESILTFQFVHNFISTYPHKVKNLNFSRTLIDGDTLEKLAVVEGLQVEELVLTSCDQLTNTGIISFINLQRSLTILDLSSCVRVTDQSLQNISICLPDLKVLKLKLCRAITDLGITCLSHLLQLEELNVSGCEFITGKGIEELVKEPNLKLKRLYLSALANVHESSVIKLAISAPNLTVLDLSSSRSGVTNRSVQEIFRHLVRLRELHLNFCDRITDAGMLGLGFEVDENETSTMNDSQFDDLKICLRSKAEQEIVNDARLKNSMQYLCESKSGDINLEQSIINLRGLRVLQLTGCNKVTDVSISYCFKFPDLQSINLSKCHQISTSGVQEMVKQCPSLEVVNFSECQGIDDKTIKVLTQQAKRLIELYVDRCNLSDHSLDSIASNCRFIRVLDIRGCRSICTEPKIRLESLKTLRHVLISKPGPYSDSMSAFKPKPPPFFKLK